MAPRFDLERVQEAARNGQVEMTRGRALDHLTPFIPLLEECYAFAAEVACLLKAGDYYESLAQQDLCDVYGVELPVELLDRYGFGDDCRTWYVKLTLREGGLAGDSLFFISLHALEKPMEAYVPGAPRGRRAGSLSPSW